MDAIETPTQPATRKKVLFIGAFGATREGREGGQKAACTNIVNTTAQVIEWTCYDTTQSTIALPSLRFRLGRGLRRLYEVWGYLGKRQCTSVLIFSSFALASLAEKAALSVAARLRGARVTISFRSEITGGCGRGIWLLTWLLGRMAQVVVAQSRRACDVLVGCYGVPPEKIVILPNGVIFEPRSQHLYEQYPRASDRVRILYAGWLEAQKGPGVLVDAFAALRQRGYEVELDFCGSGTQEEALAAAVAGHEMQEQVHFHGWVSRDVLCRHMDTADVLCLPSLTEGQPNVVIEAMGRGLAVVASDVGGVGALIRDGETGLLVEPGRPDKLADALETLITDPSLRARLATNGEAHVREHHDALKLGAKLAALL